MMRLLAAAAATVATAAAGPLAAPDMVHVLPGWDAPLPSKHFSGYLNISGSATDGKHLHYYFIECEEGDPEDKPTVLWFNGGPGCSSLDGWAYEHGPFRINDTDSSKLYQFDYTWAKLANMLYIEAPVGVGFSYSDDTSDYGKCNDDNTALDNLAGVETFYKLFPEHKSNDLWITGESYAGVYVPTLAEAILHAMQKGTYTGAKLAGIAVGNGCSGSDIGVCGPQADQFRTEFLLEHAFMSRSLKTEIRAACDWTKARQGEKCESLLEQMHETIGHIDLYNVYGPCISGSSPHDDAAPQTQAGTLAAATNARVGSAGPDACIDSITASEYFNDPDVQAAIHVKKPPERWATCGSAPGWSYSRTRPNLPRDTYPALVKNFRVVIYNGDWDSCVPYTDAEAWTEGMGYKVADPWHPWMYNLTFEGETTSQVGGYATRYAVPTNFTFITVRGGRHEVPETAPDKAFAMLQGVLEGRLF
jgi:serine carboxypeptidase-like clade 1